MRQLLEVFIKNAKAQALADAIKAAKPRSIESIFSSDHKNCINHQNNTIRFTAFDHGRVDEAIEKLNRAELHLTQALAALHRFDGLSKRELLLAANFTHGYIYMLNEFMQQNSVRPPSVKKRHEVNIKAVAA